jgi:hypothetical protein
MTYIAFLAIENAKSGPPRKDGPYKRKAERGARKKDFSLRRLRSK